MRDRNGLSDLNEDLAFPTSTMHTAGPRDVDRQTDRESEREREREREREPVLLLVCAVRLCLSP